MLLVLNFFNLSYIDDEGQIYVQSDEQRAFLSQMHRDLSEEYSRMPEAKLDLYWEVGDLAIARYPMLDDHSWNRLEKEYFYGHFEMFFTGFISGPW